MSDNKSTTTNVLHKYRSYSYHHILCACKTTAAAESLSGTFTEGLRDMPGAIQDPDNINVINDYVVVINSFKDSAAYIKNLTWESLFAQPSDAKSRYKTTTMASEGEMTIVEPIGFGLFDVINKISKKLRVSSATNMTWAIKTVFVGYTHDNNVEYITDVKPLIFMMYDIQAKMDVTGSAYYAKFIGVSNGNAKMPCYNAVNVVSLSIGDGVKTLSDVIDELVTVVNEKYSKDVAEMRKRAKLEGLELNGREIKYDIVLHDDYVNYEVDNIIMDQRGNPDSAGVISFQKNSNMEQMIHTVMRQSTKINKDAAQSGNSVDRIFKIHTQTTFTGDDTGTLTITYYIMPYEVPKATSDTSHNGTNDNYIEYDYMYSGKNVDILDFDIKMEYGMGFLQMISASNPLNGTNPIVGESNNTQASQGSVTGGMTNSTSNPDNTPKLPSVNVGTLYPSKKYDNMSTLGVENNNDVIAFDTLLAKHSQLETLETKIKVLGDPYIMNDINTLPSDILKDKVGSTAFGTWKQGPPLVKINVFLPANPNKLVVEDSYRKQFWYKGFYRVISTVNSFDNGIFSQTHDMLSMSLKDPIVATKPDEETE